jgi:hypothetical protein
MSASPQSPKAQSVHLTKDVRTERDFGTVHRARPSCVVHADRDTRATGPPSIRMERKLFLPVIRVAFD